MRNPLGTSLSRRAAVVIAVAAASALALAGCATATPGGTPIASLGTVWPAPPAGEVVALGTVLDTGGEPQLCLGAVAQSAPPQCAGIPLLGWSWDGLEGFDSAGGSTWGAYAVQGTYDGETFTATRPPIMLALYDYAATVDPTGGKAGTGTDAELAAIQEQLPDRLDPALLGSSVENGWLYVDVVWDDGTWQDAADAEFGDGRVAIRSALRSLGG